MNKCACGAQIKFYQSSCDSCAKAWVEGVKAEEAKYTKAQLAEARKDA